MKRILKFLACAVMCLMVYTSFFAFEVVTVIQPKPEVTTYITETVKHMNAHIVISPVNEKSYLCAFKPNAIIEGDGCVDVCTAKGNHCDVLINCRILNLRPLENEFEKADVVVNHYGVNVSTRDWSDPPYLAVFYKGESNANEGLDTLKTYPMYDMVISFQRYHILYFTYAHAYQNYFLEILAVNNDGRGPTKDSLWTEWQNRLSAVAVFVSNCNLLRKEFIKTLSMFYEVHSFGTCENNRNVSEKCSDLPQAKQKLCTLRDYKYALSMENTKEPEYVTEKVYEALLAGAVPLYWGAPNAAEFVPNGRKSFIEIDEYLPAKFGEEVNVSFEEESEEETGWDELKNMSDHLRRIETDKGIVMDLLQWRLARKAEEWGKEFWDILNHRDPICNICVEAYRRRAEATICKSTLGC